MRRYCCRGKTNCDAERRTCLAAVYAIAAEPDAISGDDGAAIDQRSIVFLITEPTAPLACPTGVGPQRQFLDQQWKACLRELGRLIAGIGNDVDGVVAVSVSASAGAAAEDFARQK